MTTSASPRCGSAIGTGTGIGGIPDGGGGWSWNDGSGAGGGGGGGCTTLEAAGSMGGFGGINSMFHRSLVVKVAYKQYYEPSGITWSHRRHPPTLADKTLNVVSGENSSRLGSHREGAYSYCIANSRHCSGLSAMLYLETSNS